MNQSNNALLPPMEWGDYWVEISRFLEVNSLKFLKYDSSSDLITIHIL